MPNILVDTTKLSERGQVVIPKDIREKMGLEVGTKLMVIATQDAIILQKSELMASTLKTQDVISKALAIIKKIGLGH